MYEEHPIPYSIIMAGLNCLALVFFFEYKAQTTAMGIVFLICVFAGVGSIISAFGAIVDEWVNWNGKTVSLLLYVCTTLDFVAIGITLVSLLFATKNPVLISLGIGITLLFLGIKAIINGVRRENEVSLITGTLVTIIGILILAGIGGGGL